MNVMSPDDPIEGDCGHCKDTDVYYDCKITEIYGSEDDDDSTGDTWVAKRDIDPIVVPCVEDHMKFESEWGCESNCDCASSVHTTNHADLGYYSDWIACLGCSWFPLSCTMIRFWWLCGVPVILSLCVLPLEFVVGCVSFVRDWARMDKSTRQHDVKGGLTMELPLTPRPMECNDAQVTVNTVSDNNTALTNTYL